ncbi:hypothetical protein BP6252_10864 [Coleophoma cylindrospora]|uniref:Heterokaryon incompatibility domain-containing protein n=1 Tax=Coleophoma cylindrospora TaxID=1849047 RepID=A0A3D8QNG4_9HELO|nr:hypothetical protein BP6252_10864 [Coleophoma cylindrospora]
MDHLPKPKKCEPLLEFSYHEPASWVSEEFTVLSWTSYPVQHGWDVEAMRRGDLKTIFKEKGRDELAVFLQSWLYFGLLATILEIRIDVSEFTGFNDAHAPILRTTTLMQRIQEWANRVENRLKDANETTRKQELESKGEIFNSTRPFLVYLQSLKSPEEEQFAAIGLSAAIIATALENAVVYVYRPLLITRDPLQFLSSEFGFGGYFLLQHMQKLGWCSSDINRLGKNSLIPGLCFGSMIARDEGNITHERCDDWGCVANNIRKGEYVPQHAKTARHDCEFIGLPCWSAERILEDDKIPLVRLRRATNERPKRTLEAVPYVPGTPYTALSHVWSDGLGDEKGNKIASCQYDRILALLDDLWVFDTQNSMTVSNTDTSEAEAEREWSTLFWLDTLCVPHAPKEPNATNYRQKACAKMAETYELASTVLVLDSELQRWSFKDAEDAEALLRISISGWMRRVWTLSEGILAKRLIVKFSDGLFDVLQATSRIAKYSETAPGCFETVPREMCSFFLAMKKAQHKEGAERFESAWVGTLTRQTSHPGDEIISTAILLRLDPVPLLKIENDMRLRMQTFLSELSELPGGILYSMAPRLRVPGFRWGPSTLYGGNIRTTQRPGLERTPEGLLIKSAGIKLSGPWCDPDDGRVLCQDSETREWYQIKQWACWHRHSTAAEILEDIESLKTTKLALVVEARDISFGLLAVLVSHVTDDSLVVKCQYQRLVHIGIAPDDVIRNLKSRNSSIAGSGGKTNSSDHGYNGTWTASDQQWCIG